jgi:hypothetical protein
VQAARGGRREHVGRRPRVPDDPAEALVALDALCGKWCRWCDAAAPNLPGGLHALLKRAARAVRGVQLAGAGELENLLGDGKKPTP